MKQLFSNRRKIVFWFSMLAIGAATTSYLFYTDDWDEKHRPGYESSDSLELIVGVFIFYTLFITAIVGSISYAIFRNYLTKQLK